MKSKYNAWIEWMNFKFARVCVYTNYQTKGKKKTFYFLFSFSFLKSNFTKKNQTKHGAKYIFIPYHLWTRSLIINRPASILAGPYYAARRCACTLCAWVVRDSCNLFFSRSLYWRRIYSTQWALFWMKRKSAREYVCDKHKLSYTHDIKKMYSKKEKDKRGKKKGKV